ncbi:ArdC family protein [Terriglobus roseus]|uniref:Chromosome partitioning protein, ParB family n=1 Tax=Terriglobus roseus TaxID=392734 RepID=A0A1H4K415_9BACT|nr:chromosome partitioning protein, ParB family [Terriglobus roseus]
MNSNATAHNVTTLPSIPKPQTSKEVIAANVQLLIEQLEAGHSEGLTAYLTAMGRFHNYSFGNILEIARQMPEATRVAGLYAWNQLGRKVMNGQKGIRILAPMSGTRKEKDTEATADPAVTHKPVLVGFQRLLDMPGYDVAALVEKSGKSASHIYARLSLLQLIPAIAEAFSTERITASHANLLSRLPHESQTEAFEQCWRKDWQDKEPHLLPAKHLSAWIQANLYLELAEAPFDREDPTLNPAGGACVTCQRRSGYNTTLFCDVQGDQCLDGACYETKVNVHIDRELAAHPELIQIENGYRSPKEKRPGAVQRGHFREIEQPDNPDAEPVTPCEAFKPAIIVYGRRVGTTLIVCTDNKCPIHDPRESARRAQQEKENPTPVMAPAAETETEEEAAQREAEHQQRRQQYEEELHRKGEERCLQQEQEDAEYEARQAEREQLRTQREGTFERLIADAPKTFTAPQLRTLLRALVNLDPYSFTDELAEEIANEDENHSTEEFLLSVIDGTADGKLTAFALRLALSGHRGIPREGEPDFLAEAEAVFALSTKKAKAQKTKNGQITMSEQKAKPNKETANKQIAA